MKIHQILAIAGASVVATASFATDLYHPSNPEEGVRWQPQHQSGALTRSQVWTSVMGAQKEGTLSWISRGYPPTYPLVKGPALNKTREQVESELRAWRSNPVTPDGMRDMGGELGWVEAR